MWAELREGLAVVLGNPLLRSIAGCTATSNLFGNALLAVYVLYVTRELGIGPALLGPDLRRRRPGRVARRAVRRAAGRALRAGRHHHRRRSSLGGLGRPADPARQRADTGCRGHADARGVLHRRGATPVYNINQVSLRQAITPDRLQGRMNASMRFIVWGTIPIGALMGGALGDAIGLWPTLWLDGAVLARWRRCGCSSRRCDSCKRQPAPAGSGAEGIRTTLACSIGGMGANR